ncbi:MAG: hypothetical protein JSV89_00600, partial [Spirochaetaceae bacterium]
AEGLRIGASSNAEFMDRPDVEALKTAIDDPMNLIPGLYWEIAGKKLGFGMTYLIDVETLDVVAPVYKEIWLNWIGTADLRYHILGSDAFLDPFLEAGFGAAGRSDITNYEKTGGTNDYTPTHLSLFGQVGGGLAVKLSLLQLGAKLDWRFWNGALPGATQDPYPLKNFSVALFGGLAF